MVFRVQSLSCGYYEYANSELVYSPEMEWEIVGGIAKFAKRALIIEFNSNGGKKRIEISYRTVEAMVTSTQPTALTVTLWEAPRFFHVQKPDTIDEMLAAFSFEHRPFTSRSRLTELPDGKSSHHEVLWQSMVYRISVLPVEFHEMTRKLSERNVLAIYHHNIPVLSLHKRRSLTIGLIEYNKSIQACSNIIPFSVLYQMEALVKNGFLLPWTVQALLKKMAKLRNDIRVKV